MALTQPILLAFSFGLALFLLPIIFRLIHLLPLLVLGCLIPVISTIYVAFHYQYPNIYDKSLDFNNKSFDCFGITQDYVWQNECQKLIDKLDASFSNDIYPQNENINQVLNTIVAYILRDFVQRWYSRITIDQTFIVGLKTEFKFILNQLESKLKTVDLSQLIVQKLVPILDQHVTQYNKALEKSRAKVIKSKDFEDSNLIVSNFQNLHKAINLNSDDPSKDLKLYYADLIDKKVIPQLLSKSEQESKIIRIIVKEILGSLIIGSLVVSFTDPDFFNKLIETQIAEQMKDRGDVKKLRELIKASVNKSKSQQSGNDRGTEDELLILNIDLNFSSKQLDKLSKSLINSNDESYLSKSLLFINWKALRIVQFSSNADPKRVIKFQKRTSQLMKLIRDKICQLQDGNVSTAVNASKSLYSSIVSTASSSSLQTQQQSTLKTNNDEPLPKLPEYTLQEVIHNPKMFTHFAKWMEHRQDRIILLKYYMDSYSLRNPLEYVDMELACSNKPQRLLSDSPNLTLGNGHMRIINQASGVSNDKTIDEDSLMNKKSLLGMSSSISAGETLLSRSSPDVGSELVLLNDDLSQVDDILKLYDDYFNSNVLHITPKIKKSLEDFKTIYQSNLSREKIYHSYLDARTSILKLQVLTYSRMKQTDFKLFVESDDYIRMCVDFTIAGDNKESNDLESNFSVCSDAPDLNTNHSNAQIDKISTVHDGADPLSMYGNNDNDHYIDVNTTGKVSDKVIQAVESALTQMMMKKDSEVKDLFDPDVTVTNVERDVLFGKRTSRLVSDDVANDLFGDNNDESIFGNANDADSLFNDSFEHDQVSGDDEINNSMSNSMSSSMMAESALSINSSNQKHSKTSNHFVSIIEQIDQLNDEIIKLNKQKDVIIALLKKAEILNNVPETKLLTRSKMSLEREITLKELKREQLLLQDLESSLYGKSTISIDTFISERDIYGNEFTSYIIKIIKYGNAGHANETDEWIVKRRFSEFYELHSYLKSKYEFVEKLDFPKRKMVMTFRSEGVSERRSVSLNTYLQELIKSEDVCKDGVFKTFLSNNDTFDIENIKKHIKQLKSDESKSRFSLLNDYDENGSVLFIQPITDLILNLFQLNANSNKWIKGKTIIMMFQQIFGSAIEKFIKGIIDSRVTNEQSILIMLNKLKNTLWPNGQWRERSVPRTPTEKLRSKDHSRLLLQTFMKDTCSKVIGNESSVLASETIWGVLQIEPLNRHLIMSLLDEILNEIF